MCGYSAYDWNTMAMPRLRRLIVGDISAVEQHPAIAALFQAGNHAQQG